MINYERNLLSRTPTREVSFAHYTRSQILPLRSTAMLLMTPSNLREVEISGTKSGSKRILSFFCSAGVVAAVFVVVEVEEACETALSTF